MFGTVATAATAAGLVLCAPAEAVRLFQPTLEETLAVTRVPAVDHQMIPVAARARVDPTRGRGRT